MGELDRRCDRSFVNRFGRIKARGIWASDVKNRDGLFFDDEENPIALDNQLPYFDAEIVAFRRKRATQW
jgi:hypothetical protein